MFKSQVDKYCSGSDMQNCNQELMRYGLKKLKGMSEDHLDLMDPYQRGASNISKSEKYPSTLPFRMRIALALWKQFRPSFVLGFLRTFFPLIIFVFERTFGKSSQLSRVEIRERVFLSWKLKVDDRGTSDDRADAIFFCSVVVESFWIDLRRVRRSCFIISEYTST